MHEKYLTRMMFVVRTHTPLAVIDPPKNYFLFF